MKNSKFYIITYSLVVLKLNLHYEIKITINSLQNHNMILILIINI